MEERLTGKLKPLQEEAMVLSQAISDKKNKLKELVKQMESKMMEPLSKQVIVEIQEKEGEVRQAVEDSRAKYDQLLQSVQAAKFQD